MRLIIITTKFKRDSFVTTYFNAFYIIFQLDQTFHIMTMTFKRITYIVIMLIYDAMT